MKDEYLLEDIAALTKASLHGNPKLIIKGISDLGSAEESDVSFLANPKYAKLLSTSKAGAIFVPPSLTPMPNMNFLVVENPSKAFQVIAELIMKNRPMQSGFQGIHKTAVIHPDAKIGENVIIGPNAVIDAKAIIGSHSEIGPGCFIGASSIIGQNTKLHANVTVREGCFIGNRVIIQPGAVIGSCGFGYTTTAQGHHEKLNQIGSVLIEDDVEIGANTTIDRARFKSTRIGKGSKIDNLVMIAHGVKIGENNLLVAQSGIAGSSETGSNVILAGQSGVVGHVSLGDGVIIAAQTGVSKSIKEKGSYSSGFPAMPVLDFNKMAVHLRRLGDYVEKIKDHEKRILDLEETSAN